MAKILIFLYFSAGCKFKLLTSVFHILFANTILVYYIANAKKYFFAP